MCRTVRPVLAYAMIILPPNGKALLMVGRVPSADDGSFSASVSWLVPLNVTLIHAGACAADWDRSDGQGKNHQSASAKIIRFGKLADSPRAMTHPTRWHTNLMGRAGTRQGSKVHLGIGVCLFAFLFI